MLHEEELLYLSKEGCIIAENELDNWIQMYVQKVIMSSNFYSSKENEMLDVIQVCTLSCIKAIDMYRLDKNCMLKTYLSRVIKNQVYTIIKKSCQEKERLYDGCICLDAPSCNGYNNEEVVQDNRVVYQPNLQAIAKETYSSYNSSLLENCSKLEQEVIQFRIDGYRQQEIANMLGVEIKVIYNAIYRLQKKLVHIKSI